MFVFNVIWWILAAVGVAAPVWFVGAIIKEDGVSGLKDVIPTEEFLEGMEGAFLSFYWGVFFIWWSVLIIWWILQWLVT